MMKAEERIMVSQRKVAVEWIIPKKFLFPFLEKKKEQCPKLCSVGSKVELLRCTVQDCTQWFNCTVILRVCICVCALVRVIAESCYTRSRLTLINQCRVLFRDMASSRPVNPPPSPPLPHISPGKDSTHEQQQSWLLLSAESSQESPQFPPPPHPPFCSVTLLPFIFDPASHSITFNCDIYSLFYDEFIKSRQW